MRWPGHATAVPLSRRLHCRGEAGKAGAQCLDGVPCWHQLEHGGKAAHRAGASVPLEPRLRLFPGEGRAQSLVLGVVFQPGQQITSARLWRRWYTSVPCVGPPPCYAAQVPLLCGRAGVLFLTTTSQPPMEGASQPPAGSRAAHSPWMSRWGMRRSCLYARRSPTCTAAPRPWPLVPSALSFMRGVVACQRPLPSTEGSLGACLRVHPTPNHPGAASVAVVAPNGLYHV